MVENKQSAKPTAKAETVAHAETVAPPVAVVAEPVKVKSEAELMAELQAALKSGDFKAVAKVSTEIAKVQKTKEQSELAEKQKVLEARTEGVKVLLGTVVGLLVSGHKASKAEQDNLLKLVSNLNGTELDKADGVWYNQDFGEKLVTVRLSKAAAKAARTSTGGGGGKKFDYNSIEAITTGKYSAEPYKDTGMTFAQAWASSTDKNWRYAMRQAVLKAEGIIS